MEGLYKAYIKLCATKQPVDEHSAIARCCQRPNSPTHFLDHKQSSTDSDAQIYAAKHQYRCKYRLTELLLQHNREVATSTSFGQAVFAVVTSIQRVSC